MEKINWFSIVRGRKTSLFRTLSIAYGSFRNINRLLGGKISNILVVGREMKVDFYMDKEEIDQLGKIALKKIEKNPNFPQEHFLEFKNRFKALIKTSQRIGGLEIENLDNSALAKVFLRYSEAYQRLAPFMTTPHIFQLILERKVKELIKRKRGKEKLFLDLAVPYKPVFETVQQKELLELTIVFAQEKKTKRDFSG